MLNAALYYFSIDFHFFVAFALEVLSAPLQRSWINRSVAIAVDMIILSDSEGQGLEEA